MRREHTSLLDDYCLRLGSLLDRRHTERALNGARLKAERAARLAEEALQQAQAAERAKTNFLANVTHELRTPLNAIIGFSEIIESGTASGEHAAYGRYIHEAGARLLNIVNDVLILARIEAGKLELDQQIASLNEVIGAAIRSPTAAAEEKGVTLRQEPAEDCFVEVDAGKLKQVLVHLLSNAVKFSSEGADVSVSVTKRENGDLAVVVRDTGRGIPLEYLDRVLEPFGQVEDHLTREKEGVGLGLPLARAMIRMHGGELTLSSEVGVGTVVEITLPADRLRATPAG
ncbi:MAG TPA: HAMP domain-containing sensor histidine kinase [Stellaceae bacterium]|nr:HAMP domain-containing sensor histidine kinase [Stellaceae bacterium]